MKTKNIITLATTAIALVLTTGCEKKQNLIYKEAVIEKQDLITAVTATGTIEPVTSVAVGTQVSGIVSKLYVDYNSVVKAGDVIAELDRTNLMSELSSTQANLRNAESEFDVQKTNYERYKSLYEKGLISANEFEQARLSYIKSQQSVTIQKENVKKAKTNLGYATITSPIDGIVLSKEVEEGQTVASSFNTPTLFTIAQDLTDMRVIADVDEADIGEVKEGQCVSFNVDAYPTDTFEGLVTQVRQQPTTESNVVTYEVVISAPNEDLKLKPGLTANVTIYTLEQKDVLAVPSKALRFTPSEAMMNDDEQIIDCESKEKVWIRDGKQFKAIAVETGTTNGILTQIIRGASAGTSVIIDVTSPTLEVEEGQQNSNPFMPGPRNRNNNNKKNASK